MTVPTKGTVFTGVKDANGKVVADGAHHSSSASKLFHDKLIKDLKGAKTKAEAKRIISTSHKKHMRLGIKKCGKVK